MRDSTDTRFPTERRFRRRGGCWWAGVAILLSLAGSRAQEAGQSAPPAPPTTEASAETESFEKQSLALRTALHYDPSLDSPLKSLVSLYRNADRLEELVGLYRGHISQYPEDAGAKAVLIRILRELNRAEADEMAQSAVQVHPDNALLNFLLYELRARREDPRALESLVRAIDLETKLNRRDAWAEILLEEAGDGAGRQLAQAHLEKLRAAEGHTAESLLTLAERMHRYEFNDLAFATLQDAAKLKPDPETGVEIEILTAKVQSALGDRDAAGNRLDALLARLAPDYWRRVEIMSLRVGMLSSEADRRRLLAEAKARYEANAPSESSVLEYAELLAVNERRREAVKLLQQATEELPQSERIERRLLGLLEQLNDQKALQAYLNQRVARFPDRTDLRYRLVKTLYALGRKDEAKPHLDEVLKQLEPAEADRRLLDLARHLRRGNLYQAAAELYQRIIDAQPDRFDVIRELAETHLALEDRVAARRVLQNLPVTDATIENFLDLIQFMIAEEFLSEARQALETRLDQSPNSLDLRLQLSTVLSKSGDQNQADTIIDQARELTDTPARYRAWLESALEAHELFGDVEGFFDAEQFRLLSGENTEKWSADRIEKFLTFCELGEERQLEDRVTQALRNQLADAGLPGELKLRLRRLLVKSLERSPERAGETEQQLQQLAKEDPSRAGEYDLRRALLYHSLQRTDLAGEALESVNVGAVEDPKLLKAAYLVFVEYGMPEAARRCLEKVTQREPSDFVSWEKRLSLLAAMGEEEELRKAIRSLLAGGDRIKLGPDSIQALHLHLLDSLWRSVSRLIATGSPESFAESLPLLDSVEREAHSSNDRLWSLWARAYVLNGLRRTDARDSVIQEFTALAGREGGSVEEISISFPDGLAISLKAAVDLLHGNPGTSRTAGIGSTDGPLGRSEVAWAFETDPRSKILQLATVAGKEASDLFVLDDQGTIYRVDRTTGKLIWRERFGIPEVTETDSPAPGSQNRGGITISNSYYQIQQQGGSITVQQLMAPYQAVSLGGAAQSGGQNLRLVKLPREMKIDAEGRLLLPAGRILEARDIADGSLLWSADLSLVSDLTGETGEPGTAKAEMRLELTPERVIAFLPESSTVAAIDLASGKLVWVRRIDDADPAGGDGGLFSLNAGASYHDGKLFVYGRESVVLDVEDGSVIWRFDGGDVRTFPISLKEPSTDAPEEKMDASGAGGGVLSSSRPGYLDHLTPPDGRADAVKRFLQYQGALVAPAVHWSAARLSQSSAAMAEIVPGDRLLLFGESGLRSISLKLPLASTFLPARGVYLGNSGSEAWFLDGELLRRLDLSSGRSSTLSLAPIQGEGKSARAVLSGGRVYAIGDSGIRVHNAWSGELIAAWQWPPDLQSYRNRLAKNDSAGGISGNPDDQRLDVWQGMIRPGVTAVSYCLPIRDLVDRDTLFALAGDSAVVALRNLEETPKAKPQTEAPAAQPQPSPAAPPSQPSADKPKAPGAP
ncbi:MAG: PQQ-binding-like beta-propeller repeat protein [Verrucomicrobiae bacterium]|nr:PQQ-binding-like beta-propeller repeat protein [Verrucomicrobiae bacterium]